jgi:SH3 domain
MSANPGTTSTAAPVLRRAKALFAYRGTYDDELTISEGDLIDILSFESIEEGWYRARLADGKVRTTNLFGVLRAPYVLVVYLFCLSV